jgi:hypothetical protein
VCEAPGPTPPCDLFDDPPPPATEMATRALGLGCEGEPDETIPVDDVAFEWGDYTSWKTPRTYGNGYWSRTHGDALLLLTNGMVPEPDGSGTVTVSTAETDAGSNGNPTGADLPPPIQPTNGSNGGDGGTPGVGCTPTGDCSDTLAEAWDGGPANNLIYLRFSVDVPPGTFGWRADLGWLSAEFPERTPGDLFIWWQSSEAFTGNVATLDGGPLNVAGLTPWLAANGLMGDHEDLLGTGYEGTTGSACMIDGQNVPDCPRAAATGWLTLAAPVTPGEPGVQMVLAIFDLDDNIVDTTVVADRFRWDCEGCAASGSCGLTY